MLAEKQVHQVLFFYLQNKGFDCLDGNSVLIFSNLAEGKKFAFGIAESNARAARKADTELFEINLTSTSAKLFKEGGKGECGMGGE